MKKFIVRPISDGELLTVDLPSQFIDTLARLTEKDSLPWHLTRGHIPALMALHHVSNEPAYNEIANQIEIHGAVEIMGEEG